MKVVSTVNILVFTILTFVHCFQADVNGARYCLLMAMMWAIYLKLLCVEEGE